MAVYRPTPVCANCKTPFKGVYKEADNFCGDLFIKWEKQCDCKFTVKLNINPPEENNMEIKTAQDIAEKHKLFDQNYSCDVAGYKVINAMEAYAKQERIKILESFKDILITRYMLDSTITVSGLTGVEINEEYFKLKEKYK